MKLLITGNDLFCSPMEFNYANQSASIIDGGIMFGDMAVEPTRGLNMETASCYGSTSIEGVSILQSEVSSITSPTLADLEDLDLEDDHVGFPLDHNDCHIEIADDLNDQGALFHHQRHFFILSSAGKPIYSMHGSQDLLVVYSGIIQTIVSFYEYSEGVSEEIKMIEAEDKDGSPIKFVFLNKNPILLMAISTSKQSTQMELIQQLDFLYNFLLSTLSKPFIDKTFSKRANFDLRQMLGPTDITSLDSICTGLANNTNMGQIFGGLECLKMKQSTRLRLERKMLNHKTENLLYALIVGPNGKLIDIMRPKRHTLHTSDLSILFEIIYNTNAFKSPKSKAPESSPELATTATSTNATPIQFSNDTAHNSRSLPKTDTNADLKLTTNETYWLPLCLPKFNPTGHLYTLIQFHQINDPRLFDLHDVSVESNENTLFSLNNEDPDEDDSKIGIIVITPYRDAFNEMKKVATGLAKSVLFDKVIWYDIWKGLLGSNSITFENVTKSSVKNQPLLPQPLNSLVNSDFNDRQRRGTFSSIRSFFGNKPPKSPGSLPHLGSSIQSQTPRISSGRESIISLNMNLLMPKQSIFHFVMKNRKLTQYIYPKSSNLNVDDYNIKMKLMRVYNELRRSLLYFSTTPLKFIQWKNNDEQIHGLGAIISGYEVYILSRGSSNQEEMIEMAMKLVRWAKKEEYRLFISSGCVF